MARQLITEVDKHNGGNFDQILESYSGSPRTASDFRAIANEHERKADGLVSGEKKDSHLAARLANNKAADCIDAANKSSAKAALLD
jgi:hypothetical protein